MDITPVLSRRKGREVSLPNTTDFLLPFLKDFKKHSKYILNSYMQVRPSMPGVLKQHWQALLTRSADCGFVGWATRPAMGAPGQQSQHYSWNTAQKG